MLGSFGAHVREEPRRGLRKSLGARLFPVFEWMGSYLDLLDQTKAAIIWGGLEWAIDDDNLDRPGPSIALEFLDKTCGKLGFRELDQRGRLERAKRQAFVQRVLMGLFGGVALIGPVLIMVLHPSQNANLITVSVATIVFALLLALGAQDSTGKDVLAATAAYAAVLVVFLGTSGSSA